VKNKELKLEQLFKKKEIVTRAIKTAEDEMHILQKCIRDILDEVGDILHDDIRFKNRIINTTLIKHERREKIIEREMKSLETQYLINRLRKLREEVAQQRRRLERMLEI